MTTKRGDSADGNSGDSVTIPARFLYLLIPAAVFGGGGLAGIVQPAAESAVTAQCITDTADLRTELARVDRRIDTVAETRLLGTEYKRDRELQQLRDASQDGRIDSLEHRRAR